jgi:DNA repair exonuclease SbcCD ATPase subunit
MQLLKLEVRNWVHHKYRLCEFTRGLVAILGENGSGKSSLFGAIRWALTGENPNFGVKTDNISQYAKEGEPSYVVLEFEHNGHIAVVSRHLLPEKEPSVLTVDGTEIGRGDRAVTAGIEKLLGVDAKFISRFIIVGQTDIFSFIDDNQTDTDKFFQRLFNTARADKCQDAIGKNLTKLTIPEVVKTAAQLLAEQEPILQQIADLDTAMLGLPTIDDFLRRQRAEQDTITQWERREKAAQELLRLAGLETDCVTQLDLVTSEEKQHADDFEALVGVTSGHEEAHAAARVALGHWQSYKSIAKAKENLQATRAAIAETRAKLTPPEKPGVLSSTELYKDEQAKTARLKEVEKFLFIFSASGEVACPTCGTLSTQLAPQIELYKAEQLRLKEECKELQAALLQQKVLESRWQNWENKQKELDLKEQQLTAAEQDLRAVAPPALSEDELARTVNEYADFQRVKAEIEPLIRQCAERRAKLDGTLTSLRERKEQLQSEIDAIAVTETMAQQAKTALGALQAQCAQRRELEQKQQQLTFAAQRLTEAAEAAAVQEKQAAGMRAWATVAEQARDALKNAPRLVAQRNLRKLETAMNELLQIFGVNFVVRVPDEGAPAFIAEFYDGRRQVAQRLSIGQKTVLALAFRVAVNAMFAEEIGLLALDEPTASLDAARIQALAPVLEKLRDLSTAKGLQCLLVTHASNLSHLFESAIELEAPELRHVPRT